MAPDRPPAEEEKRYQRWLASLDALGVQFLILDVQGDSGLLGTVRSDPRWAIDFQDRESVLLARVAA